MLSSFIFIGFSFVVFVFSYFRRIFFELRRKRQNPQILNVKPITVSNPVGVLKWKWINFSFMATLLIFGEKYPNLTLLVFLGYVELLFHASRIPLRNLFQFHPFKIFEPGNKISWTQADRSPRGQEEYDWTDAGHVRVFPLILLSNMIGWIVYYFDFSPKSDWIYYFFTTIMSYGFLLVGTLRATFDLFDR